MMPSIFLALGITKVYLLGFLFDWRTTCWICSVGSLLLSFSMWSCWETPYWLVENNREEEARKSLQWYRGQEYDITEEIEEIIQNKKEKLLAKQDTKEQGEPGVLNLIRVMGTSQFLRPFSCAGIMYLLAQWTGM